MRKSPPIIVSRFEECAALITTGYRITGTKVENERIIFEFAPEAAAALDQFRAGTLEVSALAYSSNLQLVRRSIFQARRERGMD